MMVKEKYFKEFVILFLIFLVLTTAVFQKKEIVHEKQKRVYSEQIIDINTATYDQLLALPGIGPTKAKNIIDYREKNGMFYALDDLLNVSGIGSSTLKKMKPFLRLSKVKNVTKEKVEDKININTASIDELMKLPGIGKVKAREIINYRNKNGLFSSKDELLNVKGIGPKTLEKIKSMISF
ncbi:competence protein ComEA [Thermosipho sp. 1223]|nr:competence protein ComEA [Thermosipho sp. 1223]